MAHCMSAWMLATFCCSPLTAVVRISLSALRCWRSRPNISFEAFSCTFCFFSCSALSRSHCKRIHTLSILYKWAASNSSVFGSRLCVSLSDKQLTRRLRHIVFLSFHPITENHINGLPMLCALVAQI